MVTSTNFVNKMLCFHKTNHLSKTKTLILDRKTINMESGRDNKRQGAINEITRSEGYSNLFINLLLYLYEVWKFFLRSWVCGISHLFNAICKSLAKFTGKHLFYRHPADECLWYWRSSSWPLIENNYWQKYKLSKIKTKLHLKHC